MPPELHSYAVFGFSKNLDWSTLHFVKPIDDIRVCSACKVVAKKAAFLPCRHVLCEPCYERWKPGVKVCFLDGDLCPESEVHWRVFPVERMMKSEVSCWNRENGCETITDVSKIADHFHRDCEYHTTCCPECSSTVLRRDIIAHLESHCLRHVLNSVSKMPSREGFFKEVEDIRKCLSSLEMAFQNTSQNSTSLLSSFNGIAAKHIENLNHLSNMEVEIKKVSQVTTQALSAVKTSSETMCDWTKDMKAFGACLSAELDEIVRAVNELASCESTTVNYEKMEREEHAKNLQLLHGNLRSVSSKLEKWNMDSTAVIAQSTTTKNLTEALRCYVSIGRVEVADGGFAVEADARVFENVLKLPIRVAWSVNHWSKLTIAIKTYKFLLCYTDIAVDKRYRIRLSMRARPGRRWFEFQAQMYETNSTTLAASPKKMKLHFLNARICGVEHNIDVSDAGLEDQRAWEFVSGDFSVEDLEASGSIRNDVLNVCFTFFY